MKVYHTKVSLHENFQIYGNSLPHSLKSQVARCTKIIDADSDHPKYVIHVKQFAKFVVNLHKNLAPTDVEEGMRVG